MKADKENSVKMEEEETYVFENSYLRSKVLTMSTPVKTEMRG